MNDGIEAFRSQLQKELGLSIGPKDPLLALWVSQKELLEQNAAQQQKLLSEFQAALGRNQTAWSKRWRPAGGVRQRARLHGDARVVQTESSRPVHVRSERVLDVAGGCSPRMPEPPQPRVRYGARRRRVGGHPASPGVLV